MLTPKREWIKFESLDEKLSKLKELKIISQGAKEVKDLYYKGAYTEEFVLCDVEGYVDENEIILKINDRLHSIHPDYFIDMQKSERFIIVDIETPMSLYPKDGIREVALLAVEDFRVIDKLHLAIVNNEEEYRRGYGYGLEAIEENEEMKTKFKDFITKYKYPLVAHNATFDRSFLLHWGWIDEKRDFNCSLRSIRLKERHKSYKLVELLKHYGIRQEQDHNAINDVMDLLEVLKKVRIDKWISVNNEVNSDLKSTSYKAKSDSTSSEEKPKSNNFFKYSKANKEEEKRKLEEASKEIIKDIFNEKIFVFTGESKVDRIELRILAAKYGAITKDGITKKTEYLVVSENAGKSKLKKAEDYGIKIITEDDFMDMINKA